MKKTLAALLSTTLIFPLISHAQMIDAHGGIDYSSSVNFSENNTEAFQSDEKDFSQDRSHEFGTNQPYQEKVERVSDERQAELKKEALYKSYNLAPFPDGVVGIKDVEAASVVRSLAMGASVQFLVYDNKIKEAIVDTNVLTEEINEYVVSVGKFFKKNPEFIGGFITRFTLYPNYGEPFKYDLSILANGENIDVAEVRLLKGRNDLLKKISNCNNAGYCAALTIERLKYFTKIEDQVNFDIIDFEDHLILENRRSKQVFAYNKDFREPIEIVLVLGINGYAISREELVTQLEGEF